MGKEGMVEGSPELIYEEAEDQLELPNNCTALELFQVVYRNAKFPVTTRMRAARDAIPCESPKLAVTAVISDHDYAARLDQRLRRIAEMKVINAKPMKVRLSKKYSSGE